MVYSNLWLLGTVVGRLFETTPLGNSLVRTTSAPTIIRAGFKDNMLPSEASVVVNQRVHPGQSVDEVLQLNRDLIGDERIEQKIHIKFEPHPYSPWDENAFGYQTVRQTIRQVFRDALVVPGIMVASTDTKHYLPLTKSIYRFSPAILQPSEIKRFHGHDERIAIDNYVQIVNFYHHLILMSDRVELERPVAREEL
jgi:carboxypeptidase PM20D1